MDTTGTAPPLLSETLIRPPSGQRLCTPQSVDNGDRFIQRAPRLLAASAAASTLDRRTTASSWPAAARLHALSGQVYPPIGPVCRQ